MADWAKLKVVQLKAELKGRGLSQAGLKGELVARLEAADEEAAAAASAAPQEEIPQEKVPQEEVPPQEVPLETAPAKDQAGLASPARKEPAPDEAPDAAPPEAAGADPEPPPTPVLSPVRLMADAETAASPTHEPVATTAAAPPVAPESSTSTTAAAAERQADLLKRKRRSASPSPKEEGWKRRRAPDAHLSPAVDDEPAALHPVTPALYINNLMRPLRPADLQAYLVELASEESEAEAETSPIVNFFLDAIRTHALVVFTSATAAARVRNRLQGRVWPQESNRKPLLVDFVPVHQVDDWIATEENPANRREPGFRWEVVYQPGPDGRTIEAALRSTSIAAAAAAAASVPTAPATTNPAAGSSAVAPGRHLPPSETPAALDDNNNDMGQAVAGRSAAVDKDRDERQTRASPPLSFQPVSAALAERRLRDMHSFLSPAAASRKLDRDRNRFSFEDDDRFVDRGREIFEGIRPPHRQLALDRQRGLDVSDRFPRRPRPRRRRRRPFPPDPPYSRSSDRYQPDPDHDPPAPARD